MQDRIAIRDQTLPTDGLTVDQLKQLGLRAIEVHVDETLKPVHLRGLLEGTVRISAILLMTDFASGQVDWMKRAIEYAIEKGARVVRVDPLTARKDLSADQIADNCIRQIHAILKETRGVRIGLENHAHFANAESFLDRVLAEIPNEQFGLTLDTGNFYWFGYPLDDVYRLVDKYAPRTVHTHVKSVHYPTEFRQKRREVGFEYMRHCCGLAEGDLDLPRIIRILNAHNYTGDFCIENESLFKLDDGQKMPALLSDVNTLRNAIRECLPMR